MGMQDRDYYREWWAEKEGLKKKRNVVGVLQTPKKPKFAEWHPVLILLMTSAICLVVFFVIKFIAKLAVH